MAPWRCGRALHEYPTCLDADGVRRYSVSFVAWFARAGLPVELPVMPGADDVVAVEPALPQRPADVIAGSTDGAPVITAAYDGDARMAQREFPDCSLGNIIWLNPRRPSHRSCARSIPRSDAQVLQARASHQHSDIHARVAVPAVTCGIFSSSAGAALALPRRSPEDAAAGEPQTMGKHVGVFPLGAQPGQQQQSADQRGCLTPSRQSEAATRAPGVRGQQSHGREDRGGGAR